MSTTKRRILVAGTRVDEEQFIEEVQRGAPKASRLLVKQLIDDHAYAGSLGLELVTKAFGPRLISFLARLFEGNSSSAHEVLIDTLERVFRRIAAYDPTRGAFRTWVFEQARYAALDRRRLDERDARQREYLSRS